MTTNVPAVPTTPAAPVTDPAAASAAVPPVTELTQKLSPQYAELARQQKAIRREQESIKAREEAFKAREAELEAKLANYIPKERLTKEPWQVFQEAGLTAEQLTNIALNPPNPHDLALQKLMAEIEALKSGQTKAEEAAKTAQQQQYEQAISKIRAEATTLVESDAEYELTKATGSAEAIVELIKQTYEKTGEVLSTVDAAKRVEGKLLEETLKIAQLGKIKAQLSASAAAEAAKSGAPVAGEAASEAKAKAFRSSGVPYKIKTLTNAGAPAPTPTNRLTDRMERAKAIFYGEQK